MSWQSKVYEKKIFSSVLRQHNAKTGHLAMELHSCYKKKKRQELENSIESSVCAGGSCEAMGSRKDVSMQEWTDAFITNAQHELVGMVKDWKYDYGADDKACSAMLLWMVLKLNPKADLDASLLQPFDQPS